MSTHPKANVSFVIAKSAFLLLTLLVLLAVTALWAFIYLPKTTITIHPSATNRSITQTIILSSSATEPDFSRYILPAHLVSKELEQSQTMNRTDAATQDDFAKGTITLVNNQAEDQALLPKTHLKYERTGVYFLTDTPVRIPAHGEVAMNITAEQKGASGNVEAGKFIIDKLPVNLQSQIYGTSTVATSGGTIVQNPLTQVEIDKAVQSLSETLKTQAAGELTAQAGGATIRPELLSIATQSSESSAEVGSKTSSFTIHIKVKASGFVADENDLLSLTLLGLRAQVGSDEDFVSYEPHSFGMKIQTADFDKGQAQIQGSLSGSFAHKVSLGNIQPQNLLGLSASEIQETLKKIPGIGSVDVSFSPFWVKTAPSRVQAITIEVSKT